MAQRVSAPASGLAYRHDFNADMQRTAQIEAVREHKKQENLKTSQYLAEQMKTTTVQGPARVKEYEDHIMSVNEKVADFFINNRDFMSDPGKFAEFKNITKQYIDNPIVEQDLRVEKHHQMFQQAAASGDLKQSEIDAYSDKYSDYLNNEDADDFVFVRPKRQDISEILKEGTANIGMDRGNYITKSGIQVDYNRADDRSASKSAAAIMRDEDQRMVVMSTYNKQNIAETGVSPENWLKEWMVSMKGASEINNWAYSSLNPNNQGDGSGGGVDLFTDQIANAGYIKAVQNGQNYVSPSNTNFKYFTQNGDIGIMTAGMENDLFFMGSNGKFVTEDNPEANDPNTSKEDHQLSSTNRVGLNLSETGIEAKVNSASKLRVIGGVTYVEMDVELSVDPESTDLTTQLTNNGFLLTSARTDGEDMGMLFGDKGKITTDKYAGKVLQKANMNALAMHNFNDAFNSAKESQGLLSSSMPNLKQTELIVKLRDEVADNRDLYIADPETGNFIRRNKEGEIIEIISSDYSNKYVKE